MPGRAETVAGVCSGSWPEPFQVEYGYISITQMQASTYSAYFCPQLNCTLFTAVGGAGEGGVWELLCWCRKNNMGLIGEAIWVIRKQLPTTSSV